MECQLYVEIVLFKKGLIQLYGPGLIIRDNCKKKKPKNVPNFTESSVNVLNSTALAESMKYYKGTWVLIKRKYSIFTWDFSKYKKTIPHSENCLP